jgi:hypothetical protein
MTPLGVNRVVGRRTYPKQWHPKPKRPDASIPGGAPLRGGWWDATQRGRERPHCPHALSSIQIDCPPIHLTHSSINRARTAIGCGASRIERARVPIDVAATSIELARTPTDRRQSPIELESVPMEPSWNLGRALGRAERSSPHPDRSRTNLDRTTAHSDRPCGRSVSKCVDSDRGTGLRVPASARGAACAASPPEDNDERS